MSEGKRYRGVDLVKVLMALVVVAIHTTEWKLGGLVRAAVPYFFIVSGYFLFRKLNGHQKDDLKTIRRWIFRILKMYLIWTAIYLPFTIYGFIQDDLSLKQGIFVFGRNLLFVGQNFMSWPLWYLLSLIWCGVILYLFRLLRLPVWSALLLGIVFAVLPHFIGNNPYFLKVFRDADNPVFLGLLYVSIGGCIRQYRIQTPWWVGAIIAVAGFITLQFSLHAIPVLAIGLFLMALDLPLPFISDATSLSFRNGSEAIYLVHMIFAGLLILLMGMENGWFLFGITVAASSVVAWAYNRWIKC